MSDEVSRRTRADELDDLNARIAALEAQIARLTAPVTEAEVVDLIGTYIAMGRGPDAGHAALTAFLEGRVKG